jgi:hypothetical protein
VVIEPQREVARLRAGGSAFGIVEVRAGDEAVAGAVDEDAGGQAQAGDVAQPIADHAFVDLEAGGFGFVERDEDGGGVEAVGLKPEGVWKPWPKS